VLFTTRAAARPSTAPPGTPTWVPVVVLVLAALTVALPAAALSGATTPLLIADAGAMVRWGQILVGVVHDLAAAATIGLLLVGAFLAPEGRHTRRREVAAVSAGWTAVLWALSAGVLLLLGFAEIAGIPVGTPGFVSDLLANVLGLEQVRLWATELVLATALAFTAFAVRTRGGLAWAFLLSVAALVPIAFTGHSSGADGHETAVTALGLHLLGVTVWLGGLLAVVVLRPTLGTALTVTVQRYSTVALWGFVTVALSGVLFSLLAVDDLGDLTSPYWLLIWGKVTALAVLGAFGYVHRRRLLADGLSRPHAFARLATVELAVMGAAVGLAVTLGRTPPPTVIGSDASDPTFALTGYPAPPPPTAATWLTQWQVNWLFLVVALLAMGLYAVGVVRLARRGDHWPAGPTILWMVGWLVFLYVTSGAPGVYGRVTFSGHMVMHMGLMMTIPILLVPGRAITLALRALPSRRDRTLGPREVVLAVVHSRWAAVIANPVVAGVVFFGSLVAFYWTDLFEWALRTHAGHVFMTAHFMLAGYAFVWSLIGTDPGPPKWPAPMRLMVLLATLAAHAFFGIALMSGTWLLAPSFFKGLDLPWMEDLLADQQLGGTIAWGIGEVPTLLLTLLVTLDWLRRDEREARRGDRRADQDDDAELAAYNARLAALAGRDPGEVSRR
jgi:cytochrome c oxidase assembly factor CtaG/putative copper export protein